MKRKTTTRNALFTSVISLLLCVSMLVGTTFAWFTDEVKSGINTIAAGNLDVEVYNDLKIDETKKVTTATKLFDEITYWEPGVVAYENLTVANLGSLALKYQLAVNFTDATTNAKGDTLAKVLKVGFVKGGIQSGTREGALDEVSVWLPLESFVQSGKLLPKEHDHIKNAPADAAEVSETFGLVIYWEPSNIDNEFNMNNKNQGKVMSIDLGIKLFATQLEAEKDSFDETYDESAAVFTVADANKLLTENKDVALVNCNEPEGILVAPAEYTGTLTLVNSTIKSVQAAGNVNIDIQGKVIVNANGTGKSTRAVAADGSAITANGKLNISGTGKLTAIAADVDGAFGIGGMNTTEISIKGITIDYVSGAYADYVADTINDKYLKNPPEGGAAIGSGSNGAAINLDNVHIVKALGGSKAAGIGARYWVGVEIAINDCEIDYVQGGASAAGIGGSRVSNGAAESGTTITIINSAVTAQGGAYGAGIGSGYDTHCQSKQPLCTINIDGSIINAKGGKYAAGVGTGYHNAALAGEIKNSTVNAASGEKYYKDSYTAAMDIGFGVVDPAREGTQADSKLVFDGVEITLSSAPSLEKIADGFYFDKISTYYIKNANGLFAFAASVNAYSNYEFPNQGQTVVLMNDIDLEGAEWIPIGDYRFSANRFCGIFDGQGNTISNFKITKKTDKNDSNKSSYGFFGNMEGTVKNLTIDKATISSYAYCGALIGRMSNGAIVENCHVTNSSVAPSYWQGGIMVGQVNGTVTVKNCTVSNSSISGKSALGGMFGPISAEGAMLFENCMVKDSAINQTGSFGSSYDQMFGGMFGYIKGGDHRVDINNCTVVNTTVKGEKSSALACDVGGSQVYVDGVNVVLTAADLQAALNAGAKEIGIMGNITLTQGLAATDVTFVGVGENAGINFNGHNIGGSNTITYKNLKLSTISLQYSPEVGERYGWYGGIDYLGHSVANYENCTISGVFTTYSKVINATNCTFDYYVQDGEEFYNIFMYSAGKLTATNCTFVYGDRAIKAYSEAFNQYELILDGCKFVADEGYSLNKALINVSNGNLKLTVKNNYVDEALETLDLYKIEGGATVTMN